MSDDEKTRAELQEEIRALEDQLREERRRARRAEAREASVRHLVSAPAKEGMAVPVGAEVEAGWPDPKPAASTSPSRRGRERHSDSTLVPSPSRSLLDLLPDAVLVIGAGNRVLYANDAAADLLETEVQALENASIWDHLRVDGGRVPETGDAPVDFSKHDPVRLIETDEPIEAASVPIVYRGQPASLTAMGRPSSPELLTGTFARTLDLFDKAFHLGPAALVITRLRDGQILEASERTVELSGLESDELVGTAITDLDVGLSDGDLREFAREMLDQKTIRNRELRLEPDRGEPRDVLFSAQVAEVNGEACALVSFVDITRRKQAALAERESRALLQKVFEATPAPIAICRLDDGTLVEVNDAMEALVGRRADDLVGRPPGEIDLWDDPDERRAILAELEESDALHDREVRFRTSDGEAVTTLSSFQRIRVDGEPCVLAVMTDITRRKQTRNALVDAKEKAEEAREKAEEVAHFRSAVLANMTHEVRTPLTVILGFTSTLREGVSEDYQRFVSLIERSGRRLLLTLDSLLDLAQIEAGTLDPDVTRACVPDAIRSISDSLSQLAEDKGVDFSLEIPDRRVCAEIDVELFGRVVSHIVDNAVKFTRDGSVVARVRYDDDAVYVDVEDTGVGIGDDFLPHVTDAFAQESEGMTRSHQGSGLGLTVSQRIIERMKGELQIESEKGKGTCVTVVLPRAEEPTEAL